mmetsp:Transcript_6240/g.13621  ORF Transcript_6240/g.13621 Transcript_6240/m.13621 type:complete len:301 (+) Transcript_6240:399-1301(+)
MDRRPPSPKTSPRTRTPNILQPTNPRPPRRLLRRHRLRPARFHDGLGRNTRATDAPPSAGAALPPIPFFGHHRPGAPSHLHPRRVGVGRRDDQAVGSRERRLPEDVARAHQRRDERRFLPQGRGVLGQLFDRFEHQNLGRQGQFRLREDVAGARSHDQLREVRAPSFGGGVFGRRKDRERRGRRGRGGGRRRGERDDRSGGGGGQIHRVGVEGQYRQVLGFGDGLLRSHDRGSFRLGPLHCGSGGECGGFERRRRSECGRRRCRWRSVRSGQRRKRGGTISRFQLGSGGHVGERSNHLRL